MLGEEKLSFTEGLEVTKGPQGQFQSPIQPDTGGVGGGTLGMGCEALPPSCSLSLLHRAPLAIRPHALPLCPSSPGQCHCCLEWLRTDCRRDIFT